MVRRLSTWLRLALLALSVVGASAAYALVPTVQGWTYGTRKPTFATQLEACQAYVTELQPTHPAIPLTPELWNGGYGCRAKHAPSGNSFGNVNLEQRNNACPANSTPATGGCQCAAGYNEVGGQCVENQCGPKTGQVGIINWTEGFTRTPDEGDRQAVGQRNVPPASGEACQSGCKVAMQTSGPGVNFWVSQAPTAQGLYRRSADFPVVQLGQACTASPAETEALNPEQTPPECPGYVGEVNGKLGCFGTAAKPVTAQPLGQPTGPAAAGNPAAGAKPATGVGSGTGGAGRTPGTGNGGNAGGPAAAAAGGKGGGAGGTASGTGTTEAPGEGEEQAACGAPGQPVCDVRVDGTDVPKTGDFSKGTEAQDASKQSAVDAINNAANITAPSWSFTFQFPTGCTPLTINIQNFVLDPCEFQGTIHDLMSMIWAAVTVFCLIGMVGRTIRES